jgi:MFS family permease
LAHIFVRNRATWLSYLMLAFYGYFLNIFGAITPFLKNELVLTYTVSSLHFSAFALGIIGAGLIGHQVIRRTGQWTALWAGAFGLGLGALLLIVGMSPVVTIGASFLMGLIGSLILTIVPSVLGEQHGELRAVAYSEANVISSILSAVAPVLVGWFAATTFGWRAALVVGTAAMLVMRFAFGKVDLPATQDSAQPDQAQPVLPTIYWAYWTALVMAVSVEFCMIFWSADYLETGLKMQKAAAAQAVSMFLVGMIAGRMAAGPLERRFGVNRVIIGALLVAAIGFVVYWTASEPLFGVIGLGVTGLGVASLYPLTLALAIGSAPGATVQASARASLASGTAIFALPLVLGWLADAVGIRPAYGVIIFLLAADLLIILLARRALASRQL